MLLALVVVVIVEQQRRFQENVGRDIEMRRSRNKSFKAVPSIVVLDDKFVDNRLNLEDAVCGKKGNG
ncbi:hypothetical protein N0V88_005107 [Collariella sp. IMI 366227]|nr:hypothetical protein N0V88_005107 [Collariella sp. IMI 366227]